MNWELLVAAFGPLATVLGVVIPMVLHLDNKTDRKIDAIREEIRDFHERLLEIQRERR